MLLHRAAATARRAGLGQMAEITKLAMAQLPLRYHSTSAGLRFEGSWKHRAHLKWIETGCAEPLTLDRFEAVIRPGSTVLDVGAYLGLYTLTAARAVGPTGRVISLEPDPAVYEHLARSIAHNGFTSRVELIRAAAYDQSGEARLDQDREGASTSTTTSGLGLRVKAIRLDELDAVPSVVKIDVEGAELRVLAGFHRLREAEHLFTECYPSGLASAGATSEQLVRAILDAGLRKIVVIDEFSKSIHGWPPIGNSPFTNLHCSAAAPLK